MDPCPWQNNLKIEAERKAEIQRDLSVYLEQTTTENINRALLRPTKFWRYLTAEFLILRGKHKGLRNNMEVFEAMSLLHPLDIFIETVFARQFI